jgi:hypothetical protein
VHVAEERLRLEKIGEVLGWVYGSVVAETDQLVSRALLLI